MKFHLETLFLMTIWWFGSSPLVVASFSIDPTSRPHVPPVTRLRFVDKGLANTQDGSLVYQEYEQRVIDSMRNKEPWPVSPNDTPVVDSVDALRIAYKELVKQEGNAPPPVMELQDFILRLERVNNLLEPSDWYSLDVLKNCRTELPDDLSLLLWRAEMYNYFRCDDIAQKCASFWHDDPRSMISTLATNAAERAILEKQCGEIHWLFGTIESRFGTWDGSYPSNEVLLLFGDVVTRINRLKLHFTESRDRQERLDQHAAVATTALTIYLTSLPDNLLDTAPGWFGLHYNAVNAWNRFRLARMNWNRFRLARMKLVMGRASNKYAKESELAYRLADAAYIEQRWHVSKTTQAL